MNSVIKFISDYAKIIANIMPNFGVIDLIDVFIVAILIYFAFSLFRDSRAGQLIKGVIVLLVGYFLAKLADLKMVTSLIEYFIQFAFVTVLVIFQPEIRKALEKFSNIGSLARSILPGQKDEESIRKTRNAINSVCDAVQMLQGLKMGALIIFERTTSLGEIVETGTLINADPSGELIGNIFFNKAPLHDGAMIIRNGKVLAAGCILPLTKRETLNSSLGTRHRAGIGMSEESDAVIVIVSEETAQISIAVNGEIERNYSKDSLRRKLYSYLLPDEDDSRSDKTKSILAKLRRTK